MSEPVPFSGAPDRILVQASSRAWYGARDYCVYEVDGRPVIAHTLGVLSEALGDIPLTVIAPGFEAPDHAGEHPGTLARVLESSGWGALPLLCGHDASPLARMVEACADLDGDAVVLRLNALNLFVDPRTVRDACARRAADPVDAYSTRDDYPALLAFDLYRVGALRSMLALHPEPNEFHVHPKYFLRRDPRFRAAQHGPEVYYCDDELRARRELTRQIYLSESTEAVESLAIGAGDKLDFRYRLARERIPAGARVLDIACGHGHGTASLARAGFRVLGGDLDGEIIVGARERYGEVEGLEFRRMDVLNTGLADDSFDHVVSMGTIEHVHVPAYLAELDRVLRPGGALFLVTPQNCVGRIPLVCWHQVEFSAAELRERIEPRFEVQEFTGIKQGSIAFADDPLGSSAFVVARSRKATGVASVQVAAGAAPVG